MNNQEAIEILKSIYPSPREIKTGEYDHVADALDDAITALEAQQADMWIPVTERMPSKAEEVIACSKEGIIVMGYIKQGINRVICSNLPFVTYDIVAWKPLDEPWKEEQP